ncbi:multiheme c-type cytochrome [Povalibacter sp.]|uniref:multiheme c-type cytochrome n=1 Tax=Povalibacter sp. TaxID=1962978 RepID=UPI002F401062
MNGRSRIIHSLLCALAAGLAMSLATAAEPRVLDARHMGVATCAASMCHGKAAPQSGRNVALNEYRTWLQHDRHAQAYRTLELPESQRIAANLGLANAATAKICLDCHADNVPASQRGPKFQLSDGVGCEACHGGAEKWLESHAAASATHKGNVARGLLPTEHPQVRAQVCLSCHLGTKDRLATHAIMGAGHPRLSFELEAFTANQPSHYTVDEDYVERKGSIEGVNLWVTGQVESARRTLELLQTDLFHPGGLFPELAFYDCHSCHHPMDEIRWNAQRAELEIQPGTVRLQAQHYVVLQALTEALEPAALPELTGLVNALIRSSEKDQVRAAARSLQEWIARRDVLSRRQYSRNEVLAVRRMLINYATSDRAGDYASAEQVVLGVESLSYSLGDRDSKNAALDALYNAVKNDTEFSPQQFATAARNVQRQF